ncbi:MAG: sorting protein, partial [Clostridia bacterium]|nr:sorting protein [Clostridia bacterium]
MMKKLYKPFFILLAVSLPQLIMMGVMGRIFWFLHTEFTERQMTHWTLFAGLLTVFCTGITLYGLLGWFYQKELHILAAYLIFIFYFGFLITYLFFHGEMISGQIPDYMLMGISPAITILTLTMPALVYSAILIVENIVERYQLSTILKPILFMLGIPLFWYFSITLVSMGNRGMGGMFDTIVPIVFIASAAAFLFLFLTVLYIILKRKSTLLYQYMGITVLVGSLTGLVLNQCLGNILGNFSHWGFYVCNILTTGIILIPQFTHQRGRLLIFIIKGCL